MKELSIEEKAKAYDKALERVKDFIEKQNPPAFDKDLIGTIFPELAESEDEKIRKRLITDFGTIGKKEWGGLEVKDILAWLEKQKPIEWSEEDDSRYSSCLYMVERETSLYNWLKSLKDRVLLQPKQKWSEEDSFRTETLISVIKSGGSIRPELRNEYINWLKSLRPQNRWKPNDEQIKVCKEVYADILSAKGFDLGTVNSELNRLEEELKKKGE